MKALHWNDKKSVFMSLLKCRHKMTGFASSSNKCWILSQVRRRPNAILTKTKSLIWERVGERCKRKLWMQAINKLRQALRSNAHLWQHAKNDQKQTERKAETEWTTAPLNPIYFVEIYLWEFSKSMLFCWKAPFKDPPRPTSKNLGGCLPKAWHWL